MPTIVDTRLKSENSTDMSEKKQHDNRRSRREALRQMLALPITGGTLASSKTAGDWISHEEASLRRKPVGKVTLSTEVKDAVPTGRIGDLTLSRMMFGGNLIGGWAHARDLLYLNKLVLAYHTMDKVMELYELGEEAGINTALLDITCMDRCEEYARRGGQKMHFIAQCPRRRLRTWDDYGDSLRIAIDAGASGAYVQAVDNFLDNGEIDQVEKALELLRNNGLVAGIGSHHVDTIRQCVEMGFSPDFWMKTLHHHNYWSAMPDRDRHDNMYSLQPEKTIAYMETVEQPWIAFKILAAGAIRPGDGFAYAFRNGADFICVGMYDFQVEENVRLLVEALDAVKERKRSWRG